MRRTVPGRGSAADTVVAMSVFEHMVDDFEQVVFCRHRPSGLRAVIAVHSTALGPALGGTRFLDYATEADAITDVCRLAEGMTYKNAAAGLDHGGGKAVIWGDPGRDRSEALIRAYARFVHRLGGRYLTAEDVGTTQADMDLIRRETPFVTGVSPTLGGSGDPSPATAWGVRAAMLAALDHAGMDGALEGRHVAVSGVGKVGRALVGHLLTDGARVTIADVAGPAIEATVAAARAAGHPPDRLTVVAPEEVAAVRADVFAPCALGAVLTEATIPTLGADVVVGAANNQLATDEDAARLADRGILYVPDYVANAGGVINIAEERDGYDRDRAYERVATIGDTVRTILREATQAGVTPTDAADRYARARIEAVGGVSRLR